MNARNIARAMSPAAKSSRPHVANQGQPYAGGISPLAMESQAGGGSWANAYGNFLPRPPQVFTQGAFGPFTPILPVPVDSPPEDGDRAQPRLWQYEVGYNLPVGQPGSEGYKLADFGTLKTLADLYSVARACIQLRKAEVRGLEWDIVPTKDASKAMRGDKGAMKDFGARRGEAVKFFKRPDPDYFTWNTWLDALLEQVFVFDALALLLAPKWSKGTGAGLLGSDLDSLQLISGPTIRPLLGLRGQVPRPPAPAYQQYLYGVPRSDLMTVASGRDLEESGITGADVAQFRGDQMLYLPMVPRRETPYGFPPVERALIPVMSGLQKQAYQLDFFKEGCCDDQTEILTTSGWKLFIDLTDADKVATRSPDGYFEWQSPVERQIHRVDGSLIHFTSKAMDVMVTGNHRMLVKRTGGYLKRHPNADFQDWGIVPASYFADNPTAQFELPAVPLSWKGTWHPEEFVSPPILGRGAPGKPGVEMPGTEYRQPMDAFCEFIGLFIAEGWVNSRDAAICVSQDEHNKDFPEVRRILDATGLKWRYLPEHRRFYTYHAGLSRWLRGACGHGAHNKHVPAMFKELPQECLDRLVYGMVLGDGHLMRKSHGAEGFNGIHYTTASRFLADDFQEMMQKLSRDCRINKRTPAPGAIDGRAFKNQHDLYEVYERLAATHNISCADKEIVEYHGYVYCVTVPNSVILTRRNGQPVWTGNSVPAVYISPGGVNSNLTPNQVRELQDALNAIAGDPAYKHKILVLPADSKVMPQKHVEIADQFDEIVMTQVTMAFDIQPMELGIMPKVSTTASPGAANQMAKSTANMHERKATKPLLKFLADIFDYILQDVCGQDDMRFMFEGLEEDEDEETLSGLLASQINVGLRSVDEGREALGLSPWGLPETSDPLWGTPTGAIPLGQIAAQGQPAPGQQPDANNPATAQPQGQPAAKPGNTGQTPGHDAAEASSQSKPSRPAPSGGGAKTPDAGKSATPDAVKSTARRDAHVAAATGALSDRLRDVADAFGNGETTAPHALDEAVAALAAGYRRVMADAARHARSDHPVAATKDDTPDDQYAYVDPTVDAAASQKAETQRAFLMGLLMAMAAGTLSADKLSSRLDLYTKSLNTAYNTAYGQTVQADHPHYEIIWRLGVAEHCRLCKDRDGQVFTFDTLPGYPGDGGFGGAGALCYGGPNCNCSLEYNDADARPLIAYNTQRPDSVGYYRQQLDDITAARDAAAQARTDFLGSIPEAPAMRARTRDEIRQQLADLQNQQIRQSGGYPGVSVEPLDIAAADVATLVPDFAKSRAVDAELESLARHLRKGRMITTWEPRHIPNRILARIAEHIAKGMTPDAAVRAVKATRRVSIDGQEYWDIPDADTPNPAGGGGRMPPGSGEPPRSDTPGASQAAYMDSWPQGGHGTAQSPVSAVSPGGPRGRPPNAVGKGADNPSDPNPVEAEHVMNQMRRNYPEKSIGWMRGIRWIGPVDVPLDRIDFNDADAWAASHEPARVKHFAKQIKKGDAHLHPVVAVQEPGENKVKIIDGHHRTLAYKKLDMPVKTYIGFVDRDGGPWDETHLYQFHDDQSQQNKAVRGYDINPRSGMISLDIPEGVIPAHPGGVTDHHITVVYLGGDLTDEQWETALARAASAAAKTPGPITAVVEGVSAFAPSAGSDWKTPAYAPVTAPGAQPLRAMLADLSASEHADWHPHVTLAYVNDRDAMPDPVPHTPVVFTHLSVHLGDHVERIPFGA